MIVKPKIQKKLLPVNPFSRPGRKMVGIRGIVVHWTGNAGAGALNHLHYFTSLADQDLDDSTPDRYAGAHYFVDMDGTIMQFIPDNEMAYHVGARTYNKEILDQFNTTYPNNCLIGIEMCHPDWSGKFTEETINNTLQLIGHLIEKYDLVSSSVIRHFDVTGKNCPKWFVDHELEWKLFRDNIEYMLRESSLHNRKLFSIKDLV